MNSTDKTSSTKQ